MVAMNESKKKCVGLQRTRVSKRTVKALLSGCFECIDCYSDELYKRARGLIASSTLFKPVFLLKTKKTSPIFF